MDGFSACRRARSYHLVDVFLTVLQGQDGWVKDVWRVPDSDSFLARYWRAESCAVDVTSDVNFTRTVWMMAADKASASSRLRVSPQVIMCGGQHFGWVGTNHE